MGLLKMDMYRMRKSRFTYVIFAVLMLFFVLECLVLFGVQDYTAPAGSLSVMECSQFMIKADIIIMFIMFFAVRFVSTEFSSGFIKNVYGRETRKVKLFLSKVGVVAIYTAVIFAAVLMISVLGQFFFNHEVVFGDAGAGYVRFLLVQYLMHVAFGTAILCIATVLQNSAASMIIGILYITLGRWIYMLLDQKVQDILGLSDFNLSDYVVFGNLALIDLDSRAGACIRASVVSVVFFVIAVFIGQLVLRKRDVR